MHLDFKNEGFPVSPLIILPVYLFQVINMSLTETLNRTQIMLHSVFSSEFKEIFALSKVVERIKSGLKSICKILKSDY